MTPKLTHRPPDESATEPVLDTFPYADGESGRPLPGATARGVFVSAGTASDEPVPAADSRGCPACGDAVVNGAGLFACTDCGWYGSLR
ncbi:hypothetical protein [Natrononativus amylolyticus]|uniref:hypothetical protein n=1 Tax=Natrononativus amylolyticus TaxID=2963434 RepID=UPI0020CCBD3D|nr:hypothetical protein [Natrononativus amylolyticus]